MARSGTNYFSDLLKCHPSILRSPGKFWEFVPFRYQHYVDSYVKEIEKSKHAPEFSHDDFLPFIGRAWVDYLTQDELVGERVLLWKEPSVSELHNHIRMFPTAKMIFVVRDGRDIIESSLQSGFVLPKRDLLNYKHWRRYLPDAEFKILVHQFKSSGERIINFMAASSEIAESNNFIIFKYEEMLLEPESRIEQLCQFIGLDFNQFSRDEFDKLPIRGSSFLRDGNGKINFGSGIDKPTDFQPVKRWAKWSEKRQSYFQNVCGQVMADLGYEV